MLWRIGRRRFNRKSLVRCLGSDVLDVVHHDAGIEIPDKDNFLRTGAGGPWPGRCYRFIAVRAAIDVTGNRSARRMCNRAWPGGEKNRLLACPRVGELILGARWSALGRSPSARTAWSSGAEPAARPASLRVNDQAHAQQTDKGKTSEQHFACRSLGHVFL